MENVNDGEAAWVLFKRGDVFQGGIPPQSGAVQDRPFLYSSYGTAQELPIFLTGAESAVSFCCTGL